MKSIWEDGVHGIDGVVGAGGIDDFVIDFRCAVFQAASLGECPAVVEQDGVGFHDGLDATSHCLFFGVGSEWVQVEGGNDVVAFLIDGGQLFLDFFHTFPSCLVFLLEGGFRTCVDGCGDIEFHCSLFWFLTMERSSPLSLKYSNAVLKSFWQRRGGVVMYLCISLKSVQGNGPLAGVMCVE